MEILEIRKSSQVKEGPCHYCDHNIFKRKRRTLRIYNFIFKTSEGANYFCVRVCPKHYEILKKKLKDFLVFE